MKNENTVDINELLKYKWWQLKRHSAKGKPVFTCLIQDTEDVKIYYDGQHVEAKEAVAIALQKAAVAAHG